METSTLFSLSLLLLALAAVLLAWPLLGQWRRRQAAEQVIDNALVRQAAAQAAQAAQAAAAATANALPPAQHAAAMAAARPAATQLGAQLGKKLEKRFDQHWLETRLGRAVVTAEEQQLLEQCGYYGARTRAIFGGVRVVLPLALALGTLPWHLHEGVGHAFTWGFVVFALGFFAPKVWLRRRARQRFAQVDEELPVLIDMLRLLQGVGLSIDQSLQIIVVEFGALLQVLGPELQRANQQFASGRSREQTLLRIGRLFDNEDLKGLITLLTQVDRHGGAVQEPLRQFGERLQVARKARMKDKIGRLTVKMTGVMVISLLPVLLIITAGPGFLGAIRMLAHMNGVK